MQFLNRCTIVIATDLHDLDMVLIASTAFEKILLERSSTTKLSDFEAKSGIPFRDKLVAVVIPIGALRYVNDQEDLGIPFDELQFKKLVDRESLEIQHERLATFASQKALRTPSVGALEEKVRLVLEQDHSPWHLCCGHDVIHVLSIALRYAVGSQSSSDTSHQSLSRELRLAFDWEALQSTNIYNGIRDWEHNNPGWTVLRPTEFRVDQGS